MSLPDLLSATAARLPEKTCIVFRDQRISYAAMDRHARRVATTLVERGIKPGDRVVLLGPNRPEWIATLFGIVGSGAVLVPINAALTPSEITFIVKDSEAAAVIADEGFADRLDDVNPDAIMPLQGFDSSDLGPALDTWVSRAESDPAVIFYTSGTTGRPKGAVLSHAAKVSTAIRVGQAWGMTENDRHLLAGSLSFIYNSIINAGSAIAVGGTVVLQERFHPGDALKTIEAEKITVLMSVPTMYVMMVEWATQNASDTSSVRVAISAGASLAPTVILRARERLGIELLDGWGMTEGTPITGYDVREFKRGRPESAGRALPGCEVRIVGDDGADVGAGEVGELIFKSPSDMSGYFKRPADTTDVIRNGWIYSGDLARRDSEDFVYIVGRRKDMIIRGGANIYPAELEEVIFGIPEVAECAVVGVPDERYGEIVKAFVVPAAGKSIDRDAVVAFCKSKLADYKVPSLVEFVEALPKGPTGKVLKRLLVEPHAGQ